MLIFFLLTAVLDISSSAPIAMHGDIDPFAPLTAFGRELPPCLGIGRYRTKRDIIWGCLSTIIACTWAAVHPNLPDEDASEWEKFKTGVRTMIYALIGPEFVTMWAMRQRIGALKHVETYNARFFPGYKSKSLVEIIQGWFRKPDHRTDGPWTLAHGFLLEMDGLCWVDGENILDVDELDKPVIVPEREISDKSKRDSLGKLVVVLQTTWFITQCLARWITHLPVTELEAVTLAFASLNVITYILWWYKPQNMQVPIRIQDEAESHDEPGNNAETKVADEVQERVTTTQDAKDSPQLLKIVKGLVVFGQIALCVIYPSIIYVARLPVKIGNKVYHEGFFPVIVIRPILAVFHFLQPFGEMMASDNPAHTFYSSQAGLGNSTILSATSIFGLIFGGLHMIPAWTVAFPSSAENLLWRICSFCITVLPLSLLLIKPIAQRVVSDNTARSKEEVSTDGSTIRLSFVSTAGSTTASTAVSIVGLTTESTAISNPGSATELTTVSSARPPTLSTTPSSRSTILSATPSSGSTVLSTAASTAISSTGFTTISIGGFTAGPIAVILIVLWIVVSFSYVIARIILLVLTFTTLRDVPQGAYLNIEWTTFLPHF